MFRKWTSRKRRVTEHNLKLRIREEENKVVQIRLPMAENVFDNRKRYTLNKLSLYVKR